MRMIFKIAKVEIQTLFYSPVAWLIIIIFTFQTALGFMESLTSFVRMMELGNRIGNLSFMFFSSYGGLFKEVQDYLYLYIPLLTMGLMSRELSSGSIKLLYAAPVTNTHIILGKYLSMMIYGGVLVVILAIYVVYGYFAIDSFDLPAILSGLLGLYLLLCTYAAIGLFMSSLTSYQVVATMGTLAILAILNYVGRLWQNVALIRDITWWLSISGRCSEFINGLICSEDVLYFLIVTVLFISLSIIRLKSIRQKSSWTISIGKYVGVILLACTLGYLSSRPQLMTYYDATYVKRNTLTENTQRILAQLDGGLTINTYTNILDKNYQIALPDKINEDLKRFKQYRRFKPEIKMNYIYYYDKADNPRLDATMPNLDDRERMIKLAKTHDVDTNMFLSPEEIRKQIDLSSENNRFVRQIVRENGQKTFLRVFNDMYLHPFESEIAATLKRMVMKLPCVGFISGNGERDSEHDGVRGYKFFAQDKLYRYALVNQGFDIDVITLQEDVPQNINILVLSDMRRALTEKEMDVLRRYVDRGGNMLIAGELNRQEVMNPIVDELFGVQFMQGQLVRQSDMFSGDLILAQATPACADINYNLAGIYWGKRVITMPGCVGLSYTENKGFQVTPILTSDSTGSWNTLDKKNFIDDTLRVNPAKGEIEQAIPTALALTRKIGERNQKILILGDADCLSNEELSIMRKIPAANHFLITGIFYWMSDEEAPVDVRRPEPIDKQLKIQRQGLNITKGILLGVLPSVLLLLYLILMIRRKGR